MKSGTEKKRVWILVAVLAVTQGIYVIFPLPDIWPLSNYTMFSTARPSTTVSKHEIYGLTESGEDVALNHPGAFSPLDRVRLAKGIRRILDRERFVRGQEERVENVLSRLGFLPVERDRLKRAVGKLLPYREGGMEVSPKEKEKDLGALLHYLLSQYERNRAAGIHDGPAVTKLSLYSITWNWTDVPPEKVVPRRELVYSAEQGLVDGEK